MIKHKFNIFPEMADEDYKRLKNDLSTNGYDKDLPIWTYNGEIIDGWNRQRACNELGIEPKYKAFVGTDNEAIEFVMRTNKRRNLNSSQWSCIAAEATEMIDSISKAVEEARRVKQAETQKETKNPGAITQLIAPQPAKPKSENETRQKVAEVFNTNRTYVSEAVKLKANDPEKFEQVKRGEKTLSEVTREIKKEKVIENLNSVSAIEAKKITGKFDTIVIDPPWAMEKIVRKDFPNQVGFDYPTMTEEELQNLDIPMSQNCHVWLWTTHKFLPMAFRLLDKWGLKYVCNFVWHKPGGFQPFGLPQYNCEFALYARLGTPIFTETKAFPVCFNAPRGAHSEKPQEFYDIVKRVTAGRRLDMFNRRKIDGFEVWGKEAAK